MSNQKEISTMFNSISSFYEFFNIVSSLGLVIVWRTRAALAAGKINGKGPLLEVGVGNGGLSRMIRRFSNNLIVGIDISRDLTAGSRGVAGLEVVIGDAFRMPFRDGVFEGAFSAFVLRSLERVSLMAAIKEVDRVVKEGGILSFVDMAKPEGDFSNAFFKVYLRLARAFGSIYNRGAYSWLVESIIRLNPESVDRALALAGFSVSRLTLAGSIAYLWTGLKYGDKGHSNNYQHDRIN